MRKLVLSSLLVLIMTGCTSLDVWQSEDKIRAIASTTFIADFLRNVAGDRVEINVIMKEGTNHHAFEASIRDAKIIGTADIIFINGAELEGSWFNRLIDSTDSIAPVITTSEGIDLRPLLHPDHVHEDGDPHIWHNTQNAKRIVENITRGMAAFDPDNAAIYEANAARYLAQLDELEAEIQVILSAIPAEQRKLISSHEAFGYFADQFGFEVVGTISIATQSQEPDRRQMQDLIYRVETFQVPTIFTENTINPRLAEQIAYETGANLSMLYSDSLGPLGSEGDTYIKMMLYNARVLATGLS